MARILINRRARRDQPWGGGNAFLCAFEDLVREAGHEIVHGFDHGFDWPGSSSHPYRVAGRIDRVLLMDPRPDELGIGCAELAAWKQAHPGALVVHRVNECDARKGTTGMDDLLRRSAASADRTIFVSEWIKAYHTEHHAAHDPCVPPCWPTADARVVVNGVDRSVFRPIPRRPDGIVRVVAHHWSDNPMKGQWAYELIDRLVAEHPGELAFTYIGRTQARLPASRIVPPLSGQALGDELARHDVYVSGSSWDPGPNHILEALACGLPTYAYCSGGGAAEFVGRDHLFGSNDELEALLMRRSFAPNAFVPPTWEDCVRGYMDALGLP